MSATNPHQNETDVQDWRASAACLDDDPELFFPLPGDKARTAASAKAVCARCPVFYDCGNAALDAGDRNGIRAGLNLAKRSEWVALHRLLGRPVPNIPRCVSCGNELGSGRRAAGKCWNCVLLTDAGPARQRLDEFRAAGWSWRRISAVTGVDRSTLIGLTRRPHVRETTERRILAVEAPEVMSA